MQKRDFFYSLPKELIAQTPLPERSASRLMVMERKTGAVEHKTFTDILDYLNPGDCLVLNDTKVIPARLISGRVELLLLTRLSEDVWEALVKPGKKARPGDVLVFGGILTARVEEILDGGKRRVRFSYQGVFEEILEQLGKTPLPPYIREELLDKNRYQTVYAAHEGSAAAPTAGLHFTQALLEQIRQKSVAVSVVTLHVGLGTFRPVKEENVEEHVMHAEYYVLDKSQADLMNACKRGGGRLVCVGTTSCRTVESRTADEGVIHPGSGWTDIFIYPGYRFKAMDALITNFHLPESTLLMLAAAFSSRDMILSAYRQAIEAGYRFFSFGDAMLLY
ncbi:MAG: tRNA preQ1(34) S-adenosylmethionine ribosyltransferase-isomerase QueA [Clostridiales bacterium]|nr:tRNA preQ1(34) S-adenosylmethionine ribosyltransferase-isomerase QueA [Clostridiales bacterium]